MKYNQDIYGCAKMKNQRKQPKQDWDADYIKDKKRKQRKQDFTFQRKTKRGEE